MSDDISASLVVVPTLLTAKVALMPNICFPVADVRDVADIHVRAMTDPAAADEHFIVCCDGGPITMAEAAYILRDWTGVNSLIKAPVIGDVRHASNRKAKTVSASRRDRSMKRCSPPREASSVPGLCLHRFPTGPWIAPWRH